MSSILLSILLCPSYLFSQQSVKGIIVAAAADLAPAQAQLAEAFQKASGERASFNLASSGMLARQIELGAPYDVYLSANEELVRSLANSGHIRADSVQVYALGRIALWSRSGAIRSLDDLRKPRLRHVAIANPSHAPYGVAAQQALENQGLLRGLKPRLVYGENVRQAFEYAASGDADATVTAWTLVFDKGGILLPESWHAPIRQACGVVGTSRHQEMARRFVQFLLSSEGQQILRRYGLFPPR